MSLIFVLIVFVSWSAPSSASEEDIDFLSLSIEELMQIEVKSVSAFDQSIQNTHSAVYTVTKSSWERNGDRSYSEALSHAPGVYLMAGQGGARILNTRGYGEKTNAARGQLVLLDGVPLNELFTASNAYTHRNLQLGILEKIDFIRGAGSSTYGANAFHSVINANSYRNSKQDFSISGSTASDNYSSLEGQLSIPISSDLTFNFAYGAGFKEESNEEYRYTDPEDQLYKKAKHLQTGIGTNRFKNNVSGVSDRRNMTI